MLAAYDAPDRGYHDLEHLAEVLLRVEEICTADDVAGERDVVHLAAFFHDVVYDSTSPEGQTNEDASAQRARTALASQLSPAALDRVVALVRATYDHRVADGDHEGAVLMDADLAILAAEPDRYARYVAGVRREYTAVPDEDFRAGRAQILADLAERDHLFRTDYARRCWEPQARANLAAELRELRRPPG